MEQIELARILIANIATALHKLEKREHHANIYLNRLVDALKLGSLERTPLAPCGVVPLPEWHLVLNREDCQTTRLSLDTLQKLEPSFSWFGGSHFWPEPEHKKFTDKLWGAPLIGQDDATFSSENQYIALLGIIGADTTYPLHQHRIEEAYYILSGNAEWSHDGKNWKTLPPGTIFHNRPYQPHAIRTKDESLMFISFYLPPFGWEGGIV